MARPREIRLTVKLSDSLRKVLREFKAREKLSSARIDKLLGHSPQWLDNTLNTNKRVVASRALKLLDEFVLKFGDDDALWAIRDHIRRVVRGIERPIPMIVPAYSVELFRDAFMRWASANAYADAVVWAGRASEFLDEVREDGAWALRVEVGATFRTHRHSIDGRALEPEAVDDALFFASDLGWIYPRRHPRASEERSQLAKRPKEKRP